ncbi:MAG: hydrogenase maturation nickel metallochaperone HypA [Paracoccaceae bacterium]
MHELAMCQGLLSEVARLARVHGATAVTRLSVQIGPLSGVEASQLSCAFGIARIGTLAETAKLDIQVMSVGVWCEACAAETEVAPNALLCGDCGDWHVTLRSGNELLLKSVDLALETVTPAQGASTIPSWGGHHV